MTSRTSAEAYSQIKHEGLLRGMRWAVYEAVFEAIPRDRTACEIAEALKISRRDVSSRCSELVRRGVFLESRNRPCAVTGRNVTAFLVSTSLPVEPDKPEPLSWDDALALVPFETVRFSLCQGLRRNGVKAAQALAFLKALDGVGLTVSTKPAALDNGQGTMFGA